MYPDRALDGFYRSPAFCGQPFWFHQQRLQSSCHEAWEPGETFGSTGRSAEGAGEGTSDGGLAAWTHRYNQGASQGSCTVIHGSLLVVQV